MKIEEIQKKAFGMPYCSPSASKIEYKMTNREYFIISYETDIEALQEVVPEPLKVVSNIVKMEFMKMPDANGFGSFQEAGQQIEVEFEGKKGVYAHAMYVDDVASISAGREIWGYPKKYAKPSLRIDVDTLLGTLHYNSTVVAIGSMGYKYVSLDSAAIKKNLEETPIYMLKIIPHVNMQEANICQLTECYISDVTVHGAWTGPCELQIFNHALANLNKLPIRKILGGVYFVADVNLIGGRVAFDYLAPNVK